MWLPIGKFNLRGDFFYEIVRVTSSAKAFFEVVDVLIEGFLAEELVLRSLMASPFMRPFLTPWGLQEEKCVYWKVSVGLKCVRMSRETLRHSDFLVCDWSVQWTANKPQGQWERNVVRVSAAVLLGERVRDIRKTAARETIFPLVFSHLTLLEWWTEIN